LTNDIKAVKANLTLCETKMFFLEKQVLLDTVLILFPYQYFILNFLVETKHEYRMPP